MANAGILPDEFIWEEYIKDKAASCAACYQLHIIEYLLKHSAAFFQKFGERYDVVNVIPFLQEKAIRKSCPHSSQWARAKPCARMPHSR
jgi:hypothetical protein